MYSPRSYMDFLRILCIAGCISVLKTQPLDVQVHKLSRNAQDIMKSQRQTLRNSADSKPRGPNVSLVATETRPATTEILKYSPYTLPKNFYPAHKCGDNGTLLTLITSFNDNFDYLIDLDNKKSVYRGA